MTSLRYAHGLTTTQLEVAGVDLAGIAASFTYEHPEGDDLPVAVIRLVPAAAADREQLRTVLETDDAVVHLVDREDVRTFLEHVNPDGIIRALRSAPMTAKPADVILAHLLELAGDTRPGSGPEEPIGRTIPA